MKGFMRKALAVSMATLMVIPMAACSKSADSASTGGSAASGDEHYLNIWCWNDEFQSRFNDFYPEVKEVSADGSTTTLNDGTVVKWTINPNEGNNYQNKLDEALLAQESAADNDKIDILFDGPGHKTLLLIYAKLEKI